MTTWSRHSLRTIERHKYSLMDKLKLRTTAELTQYAIMCGLITPP
jgi:DNA-binding CsgD family transcriptional regulator